MTAAPTWEQPEGIRFNRFGHVASAGSYKKGTAGADPSFWLGWRELDANELDRFADEFAAKPPLPPPLASVLLPDQAQLVLLVSDSAPKGKLKLSAYDVSAGKFRAGDYRVFNFSEKPVSLIFGRAKFALKPGDDKIVSDVALQEKALDVVVQIAQVENGEPKRVYNSAWGHQPVKRTFVFLFNGSHPTRPIAIRRFSDRPE